MYMYLVTSMMNCFSIGYDTASCLKESSFSEKYSVNEFFCFNTTYIQ